MIYKQDGSPPTPTMVLQPAMDDAQKFSLRKDLGDVNAEQCFGQYPVDNKMCRSVPEPRIAPGPVLDAKHMNYSLMPYTDLRAYYYYQLEDLSSVDENVVITILTPFFNSGKYINDVAKSVFGQSFQLFQWIIVNDASTDKKSLEELAKYRNDPRVTVIDLQENHGLPGARNAGVAKAKGKYLLLLDPDDMIEQTYVEKAVWFLETHPEFSLVNAWSLGFAHNHYVWMNGFQQGDRNLKENSITVATVMRTQVLRDVGGFDASLKTGMEDWDLWLRMADNGHWGYTIEEFHFWYRVSPPGKWSAISNATNFQKYVDSRVVKYKKAFTEGVPKIFRTAPEKFANIPKISDANLQPASLFNNRLIKCRPRAIVVIPSMEVGGADQFNFNFLQGLALEGWEITIVTTKEAKNPWLPQFARLTGDIFVMPNFLEGNNYPNFLTYLVKSRNPDVVFVSNSEMGYLLVPLIKHHCPTVTVVDYVHSETPKWKNGGYARYSYALVDVLDRSIYASDHLRDYVIEHGHIPEKTATVRIGIDPYAYTHNPVHRQEIRSVLNISDSKILLIYVARLADEKQPLLFAKVMKALSDKGLDFLAVAIGDGELYGALNETVHSYGIEDKVLLWGAIPNKQVGTWMSAADIFFLPSKVEGISLAIYEAMSMGITVVSSLVGGQAELVINGTGFLVKPGSPTETQEYIEALEKLVGNPTYTKELGKASRNRVLQGFSSQAALAQIKKEFCVAIKSNPKKRVKDVEPILREYAALAIDYFRLETDAVNVWKEYQQLVSTHQQLLDKINAQPVYMERPPSPFPKASPEEVLRGIKIASLRPVYDIFEEKNIDRTMRIELQINEAPFFRTNPKTVVPDFDHNSWMIKPNHDVNDWNNKIPFPFRQQEFVVEIPNGFVGTGESGTVFDYERMFTLRKGSRQMFTPPADEAPSCVLKKYKKLVPLVQIYHEYGHFMTEMLPRLSLVWDRFQADPEITLLVPDFPYARSVFQGILKIAPERMAYYRFGPGWEPCEIFYAESVILPMPTTTGNPPPEMFDGLREIFEIPASGDNKTIVYFSRRASADRIVSNEDQLVAALREIGEVTVFDENSPLPSVLEVVSKAKVVIGMHGSTLAPMIWAPKGAAVVELLHPIPWLHWWATATALKHDYWLVPVDSAKHDSATVVAPIELTINTVRAAFGLPVSNSSESSSNNSESDDMEGDEAESDKEQGWRDDVEANMEQQQGWKDKESSTEKEQDEKKEMAEALQQEKPEKIAAEIGKQSQ